MAEQFPDRADEWPSAWPDRSTIHRLALQIASNDVELAEGLEGDLYLRLVRSCERGTVVNEAWIKKVLRNLLIDGRRKAAARPAIQVDPDDLDLTISTPQSTDDAQRRREACLHVMSAVKSLHGRQRQVIESRYFDQMGIQAIASKHRVSVRSVQRDIEGGMEHLRRVLREPRANTSSLAVLLGAIEDVNVRSATPVGAAATSQLGPILLAASAVALTGIGLFVLSSPPPNTDAATSAAIERPPDTSGARPSPISEIQLPAGHDGSRIEEDDRDSNTAAEDPEVPVDETPTSPDDEDTAAAPPTRTFEIRLVVDGVPASTESWRRFNPQLEPDAPDARTEAAVICWDHTGPDADGLFRYELPEGDGEWLFQLVGQDLPSVYVQDEARGEEPLEIRFDTGGLIVQHDGATLSRDTTVAVANPQPGVWVVASAQVSEDAPGTWTFPTQAAGGVELRTFVGRGHVPDAWQRSSPTWTVDAGETKTERIEQ